MNIIFCVILVTLPWVVSKLHGRAGGRTAKPPFSRSQEAQKCPVLIGLVQFDSILFYFLITIIISIHLSKSFNILFHNFFRSRSKWYWSPSEEIQRIRSHLSQLLNQNKAENFSRTRAFCFMVTNGSKLEMHECEAKHYYICGDYRGRLKKMDIKVRVKVLIMVCNLRECLCVRLLESILQLQNTFESTSYPPKAELKVCIVKVLPSYYFLSSQTSV